MAELADFELDGATLKQVAGGGCYQDDSTPPLQPGDGGLYKITEI